MKHLASFSKKIYVVAGVTVFAVAFFVVATVIAANGTVWQGPVQAPPAGNLPGFIYNGTSLQSGGNFNVSGEGSVGSLNVESGDATFKRNIIVSDSICFDNTDPANCRDSWTGVGGSSTTTVNNSSADLWTLSSNNHDIYYTNGKVGVNNQTPGAALEVELGNAGFSLPSDVQVAIAGVGLSSNPQGGTIGVAGVAPDKENVAGVAGMVVDDQGAKGYGGQLAGNLSEGGQTVHFGVYGYAPTNTDGWNLAGFFRGDVHVDSANLSVYKGTIAAWGDSNGVSLDNGHVCFGGDCDPTNGSGESIYSQRTDGQPGQWSLIFATNFVDRMIVSGDVANGTAGNIGIGTLTPAALLTIQHPSGSTAPLIIAGGTATGAGSISIGDSANAVAGTSHVAAIAIGPTAGATGDGATAIGWWSQANGKAATALGGGRATGVSATAIGTATAANADQSLAMGDWSTANEPFAIAIGDHAMADGGQAATALGVSSHATGWGSMALGVYTMASGTRAFAADGGNAIGSSIAIGTASHSETDGSMALGGYWGNGTKANGAGAVAIGASAVAQGTRSLALGDAQSADEAVAVGGSANASGFGSIAMGPAIGGGSQASGSTAIAIGTSVSAMGDHSIAIGGGAGNGTIAQGYGAIAMGVQAKVNGYGSIGIGGVSGNGTNITGDHSYAIGNGINITAPSSFALGDNVTITTPNTMAVNYNKINLQGNVTVYGNLQVTGTKNFVMDDPADPTKQIVYASLEGGESGTYTRGSGKLVNGQATVTLPEDFNLVTAEKGITAQVTPTADTAGLYVASKTNKQIVVREIGNGKGSATFDYLVQGVRRGFENQPVIVEKNKNAASASAETSAAAPAELKAMPKPAPATSTATITNSGSNNSESVATPSTGVSTSWWTRILNFFKKLF